MECRREDRLRMGLRDCWRSRGCNRRVVGRSLGASVALAVLLLVGVMVVVWVFFCGVLFLERSVRGRTSLDDFDKATLSIGAGGLFVPNCAESSPNLIGPVVMWVGFNWSGISFRYSNGGLNTSHRSSCFSHDLIVGTSTPNSPATTSYSTVLDTSQGKGVYNASRSNGHRVLLC